MNLMPVWCGVGLSVRCLVRGGFWQARLEILTIVNCDKELGHRGHCIEVFAPVGMRVCARERREREWLKRACVAHLNVRGCC